jgi:hypothetical protein
MLLCSLYSAFQRVKSSSLIVISTLFIGSSFSPTFAITVCFKPEIFKALVDSIIIRQSVSSCSFIFIGHSKSGNTNLLEFDSSPKIHSKSYSTSLSPVLYSTSAQEVLTGGYTVTFVVV